MPQPVTLKKLKLTVLWRPTRLFRTNTQKRCPFHYRGLECKSRKSRNTCSNRQIWPWSTEWSRAKANRVGLYKSHKCMKEAWCKTVGCGRTCIQWRCLISSQTIHIQIKYNKDLDFPGGLVIKNLPANSGDTGLIPGAGRFHMQWGS